ncbi:MAG: replication initiation factor domain-containing protein [Phycisphaeraceae bacterium]|nr:replication initiation factor domain-containing protein [Phycisphaeraceae bacterium]
MPSDRTHHRPGSRTGAEPFRGHTDSGGQPADGRSVGRGASEAQAATAGGRVPPALPAGPDDLPVAASAANASDPTHLEADFGDGSVFLGRPPMVRRGANKKDGNPHPDSYTVGIGIDWFRMTRPEQTFSPTLHRLQSLFGPAQKGKGMHFYEASYRFANGAMILYDLDGDKGHCIDLPGDALGSMSPDEAVAFCRDLMLGTCHVTRLDIRIDWQTDEGVGLIDHCLASVRANQLCRAKRWKPIEEYTSNGEIISKGVVFGQRGKLGSGRYVRVYDKSLETGDKPVGTWERFEAELTGDIAHEAALALFSCTDWPRRAAEIALGCVDFREANGSTSLARRPRVAWWESLLGSIEPMPMVLQRKPSNLTKWVSWVRRNIGRTVVSMAQQTGETPAEVVQRLGLFESQYVDTERSSDVQLLGGQTVGTKWKPNTRAYTRLIPYPDAAARPVVWQYIDLVKIVREVLLPGVVLQT